MYNRRMKGTRRGLHVAVILLCAWIPRAWADSIDERIAPCLACHGEKGQSTNPEIPSLGAQTSPYVLSSSSCPEKPRRLDIMNDAVKGFTDDDLRIFADRIPSCRRRCRPPRQPIRRARRVGRFWC
jgi:cytochrome c553